MLPELSEDVCVKSADCMTDAERYAVKSLYLSYGETTDPFAYGTETTGLFVPVGPPLGALSLQWVKGPWQRFSHNLPVAAHIPVARVTERHLSALAFFKLVTMAEERAHDVGVGVITIDIGERQRHLTNVALWRGYVLSENTAVREIEGAPLPSLRMTS